MSKYLKFYKKCMKTGKIPNSGLCSCFYESTLLELFNPDKDCCKSMWYWGYDGEYRPAIYTSELKMYEFTPLRQTVVLFMHEMSKK